MNGHDLAITFQTLLAIFGAITAIAAGSSAIAKMFSPFKELQKTVREHGERLRKGDEKFDAMEELMTKQLATQRMICKSLLVIMNHEITGNGIEKLKDQQEELQRFLIDN